MFHVEIDNGKINRILDQRYSDPIDITDGTGRFGHLAYTCTDEDINRLEKPGCVPFLEQYAEYDAQFYNLQFDAQLQIENDAEGLTLELVCNGQNVDGMGMFLPFNFIGRKNGFWKQQFTVSSPYHTADGAHYLFYLARPDGNSLACVVENEIDCYQINYSPYLSGHFIRGITFWSTLDKAYLRKKRSHKSVRVRIVPVSSYIEAICTACRIWNCPALYYDLSSCCVGEKFSFKSIGEWEYIQITSPSGRVFKLSEPVFSPDEYGFYRAVPYCNGICGLDCTFFVYDNLLSMHSRASKAIKQDCSRFIGKTVEGIPIYEPPYLEYRGYQDYNLCEHCMWAWSALRYLLRGEQDARLSRDVVNLLNVIDPKNNLSIKRCTYDPVRNYHTVGDHRIQEAYNGINILLDAYRLYQDTKYLQLAKTVLKKRLQEDMEDDGGVYRHGSDGATADVADYTTVTCMVFPVADMAVELKNGNDPEWQYFFKCAKRMADHVISRGLDFPTEGGAHPECNPEVEEGSMSCAALTVLYVYAKLIPEPAYLVFAESVLTYHDAFSVYTPHPCMFRSSLRWWETVWEGDTDGPAVCYGHAWTIWRAEAEYWYGILARNDARLLDSYNGFMTNFSKTDIDGTMYAIYQYEQISSGAISDKGWEMDRSNREGFPKRSDITLSRYVWARAADTWFNTVAILPGNVLMAKKTDGVLYPQNPAFKTLYIGEVTGTFYLKECGDISIISNQNISVEGTDVLTITVSPM